MPESSTTDLDPDTAFSLLSNRRRRLVVCYLAERDEPVPLSEIAKSVAARLNDCDPDAIEESEYRSVYVALYQSHVPPLAEAGIVEYDDDERTARIAHNRQSWELLQYAGIDCDRSWAQDYRMGISAVALGVPIVLGLPVELVSQWWMFPTLALIAVLVQLSIVQRSTTYSPRVTDCQGLVDGHAGH
jgi:hypothetical protein